MQEFEPDFMSDSSVGDNNVPSDAPFAENELKEDIYYNNHIIPSGSIFKVL